MSEKLAQWLDETSPELCQHASRRAPSLLPDATDLKTFMSIVKQGIGEDTGTQLNLIQAWAAAHLGQDDALASDWITLLRALKETVWESLPAEFGTNSPNHEWRILDNIFSHALVETTKVASNVQHGEMIEYMADLRQKMEVLERSKSNFIAVAAHELKTPLTIMEGYANMLRMEIPDGLERLHILLDGFHNGMHRMREIIADMIDVTMIDTQSFAVSFQPVYLSKVVEMAATNLEEAFQERNVTLSIEDVVVNQVIYADPTRLFQAINKILSNGLKYTPDGRRVTIRTDLVRQDEISQDISGYVDIQIQDTGIGIDKENLSLIFEKFVVMTDVALHSSGKTKFKGGGPGLGLPIARGIIEAHGGRVWAESPGFDEEKCPGSTFHIELPIRVRLPSTGPLKA